MFRNSIIFFIVIMCMGCSNTITCNLVYDAKAGVGESALWQTEYNRLLWTDISNKKLFVYYPSEKNMVSYSLPKEIGTVVGINKSTVLLALADGLYEYTLESKALTQVLLPNIDTEHVRFNDGKCSPEGVLWVGTMDKGVTVPNSSLYKITGNYSLYEIEKGITVSNGLIWSPDGTKMYYIDSPTYTIAIYDYSIEKSEISNKRILCNTPKEWGTPDGCTIDCKGNLWVAHWGGGIVSHWDTKTGKLIDTIKIPSPNVTSVAFGGENLDVLFITTAKNWMKPGDEEKFPYAGGLFCAKVGVKGIPSNSFIKK